jgi:hypothetical protein
LNIAESANVTQTISAPASTSMQTPTSLQIAWSTGSATSSDFPHDLISMLILFSLFINHFLYTYITGQTSVPNLMCRHPSQPRIQMTHLQRILAPR